MKFQPLCGVCTTDFETGDHPPYAADVLFEKLHNWGFEAVQFAFSSIAETEFTPDGELELPGEIPAAAIAAVEKNAAKYNLPIKVVNATFNMAHPDARVREEGIRRLERICDAATTLGARYLSLCSGSRNRAHLWSPSPENDSEAAWADMMDTMRRCTEIAERKGIILAVESEAANIISTPAKARRMMDEVGSAHLKMILDCANLFLAGTAHRELVRGTLERAFEAYGRDIVIAHGKDIMEGDGIAFCGTGRGIVDFAYTAELLEKYGYTGDMFLHGIYDEDDMPRARRHWLDSLK